MTADDRHFDEAALDDEIARYRRAALETLHQLDWCIKYLYSIRKPAIAGSLEKNRATIQRQLPGDL
jgi:hypothetical protein